MNLCISSKEGWREATNARQHTLERFVMHFNVHRRTLSLCLLNTIFSPAVPTTCFPWFHADVTFFKVTVNVINNVRHGAVPAPTLIIEHSSICYGYVVVMP